MYGARGANGVGAVIACVLRLYRLCTGSVGAVVVGIGGGSGAGVGVASIASCVYTGAFGYIAAAACLMLIGHYIGVCLRAIVIGVLSLLGDKVVKRAHLRFDLFI